MYYGCSGFKNVLINRFYLSFVEMLGNATWGNCLISHNNICVAEALVQMCVLIQVRTSQNRPMGPKHVRRLY
jgi:hypothetical protein